MAAEFRAPYLPSSVMRDSAAVSSSFHSPQYCHGKQEEAPPR
jgi:hypothetical protein